MRLQPYVRVDDIAFSATSDDVLVRFGTPARTQDNPVALTELDYGHARCIASRPAAGWRK